MMKKISIMLIIFMLVFAFVPALTLAEDDLEDGQGTVFKETDKAVDENEEETEDEPDQEEEQDLEETKETTKETDQISEELKKILEEDYATVEELLKALNDKDLLTTVEKEVFNNKLTSYEENLSLDTITSVVDKVLTEEIDLGQGFVILNNLDKSISNGFGEEKALELINNYQSEEVNGQFAFQTALELRKLSREDETGEKSEAFADEITSIIEKNGNIETSELKQLAAEYRKEAREEKREKNQISRDEKSNSEAKNYKKEKENNAAKKALNKAENGKGNSDSKVKSSPDKTDREKSSNSKADQNSAK